MRLQDLTSEATGYERAVFNETADRRRRFETALRKYFMAPTRPKARKAWREVLRAKRRLEAAKGHYRYVDETNRPRGWRGEQTAKVAAANAEWEALKSEGAGHTATIRIIEHRHKLKAGQLSQFRSVLRRRKTPVPE